MKNYFLIFTMTLAASIATPVLAQNGFGLRFGVNMPTVSSSEQEGETINSNLGFAFGAILEIGGENFAIQPEFLYSQHGFGFKESFVSGKSRFNYLQIPVLFKAKFGSDPLRFNILAGPYYGFGAGNITTEVSLLGAKEEETSSWDEYGLERFDFGLIGGVGASLASGPGRLGLDVRYQLGAANLMMDPIGSQKIQNRNFQFSLSYIFPLGN